MATEIAQVHNMDSQEIKKQLAKLRHSIGTGTGKMIASADDLRSLVALTFALAEKVIKLESDQLEQGC